jgi:hypothetical protein
LEVLLPKIRERLVLCINIDKAQFIHPRKKVKMIFLKCRLKFLGKGESPFWRRQGSGASLDAWKSLQEEKVSENMSFCY